MLKYSEMLFVFVSVINLSDNVFFGGESVHITPSSSPAVMETLSTLGKQWIVACSVDIETWHPSWWWFSHHGNK